MSVDAFPLLLGILLFLRLRLLMVSDDCAGRRTRNGMTAAYLMTGQGTHRCTLGSAGWLLVLRVNGDCQPSHESDGNDKCAHERTS
jgi:hypothetical protein